MDTLLPFLYRVAPLVDWLMTPVPFAALLVLMPMPFLVNRIVTYVAAAVAGIFGSWQPEPRRYDRRWH